ncbi:MAG TPA: hypothetical protein VK936_01865 [Longimicrobiales bacterium]|nr:hypothetical protein [Longimicrobiales bacterium]
MTAPSWLLLFWVGAAATCAAAITGTILGGRAPTAWALIPRTRSAGHGLAGTLVAGLFAYPLLYGLVFEAMHRSDALTGFALGAIHALLAFAMSRPLAAPAAAFRIGAMHVIYGTVCAFLYVTP